MDMSVASESEPRHRVISERRPEMARASLRSGERVVNAAQIGACLDYARRVVGWSLDQLACELGRDARQVRRWIDGAENAQVHVVFSVPDLREPFVIALAGLAPGCDIVTTISIRRTA